MKMNKKKVFVTALAVSLIAILSLGTLAWFNAEDEITNTFKVADSDNNNVPDFSVEVWETDEYDNRVEGKTYEDILPGDVLEKDPTIENTGNYDQYIRAYVTFSDVAKIQEACRKYRISEDLRTWLNVDGNLWEAATDVKTANGTITYCYYYKNVLGKKVGTDTNKAQLFTTVTIPEEFQQADMTYTGADFTVNVKAEALQVENIEVDTASTKSLARQAFEFIGWEAFSAYNID